MKNDNTIRLVRDLMTAITTALVISVVLLLVTKDWGIYEPDVCRAVGVYVPDGASATGKIRTEAALDYMGLQVVCGLDEPVLGCARQVTGTNQWDVYYLPIEQVMVHERCHAQYQTIKHNYE